MIESNSLKKGQKLKIELDQLEDRLSRNLVEKLSDDPFGVWMGGYKMVDGNSFGLVLELADGTTMWFFEKELSNLIE